MKGGGGGRPRDQCDEGWQGVTALPAGVGLGLPGKGARELKPHGSPTWQLELAPH